MLKKNLTKIKGYNPKYVQVRRFEEAGNTVKLRKAIQRHRRQIMKRLVANQSVLTMATYAPVVEPKYHRIAGNEDVWAVLDLQLALGRKIIGHVGVQTQVRKALMGETVNEGNLLDYGTLLDLIYAEMESDEDGPVLAPLPPPKTKETLQNRKRTAETPTGLEAATTNDEVKQLFFALKEEIKTALENFSALAGMENEGSEDESEEREGEEREDEGLFNLGSAGPVQNDMEPEPNPRKKLKAAEHAAAPERNGSPAIKSESEEEMKF